MAAVPGSIVRKTLFWAHLVCGVAAGVFIFVMSASGVLLTYERQHLKAASAPNHVVVSPGAERLGAERLGQLALEGAAPGARTSLVIEADPTAPVTASRGREGSTLFNPYTGARIEDATAGERQFYRVVENWHRWLGGDSRSTRAKLIDYGNLLFLFIVVSGIYVWLPAVWRWRTVRSLVFFRAKYLNSKVRDFAWHHVFSVWALVPLFLISLSGVVMSFPWANKLVYAAYGEQVPQRGAPQAGGAARGAGREGGNRGGAEEAAPRASLDVLHAAAIAQLPNWQRMTFPLNSAGKKLEVSVELKSTERRAPRQTISFDSVTGEVLDVSKPQAQNTQTPGQKARSWMRQVHTGEQYGVIGQTIAGLASLAACFLVYSGLALAYRRLLKPLFRRREAVA
jgi:uncharacterized iron-regulated membrane protein